jgi:L-2-hydroxyglutarate oxidase LhgO
MDTFNITTIGAGVIGLALAEELSAHLGDFLIVEKNTGFGQETNSRNSEVIHAGIYFPAEYLKTAICVEGNRLLYTTCWEREIPHRKMGKLIAANETEEAQLEDLKGQAEENHAVIAFRPEVTAIGRANHGYDLELNGNEYRFRPLGISLSERRPRRCIRG